MAKKPSFKVNDKVVYPSHGVGEIIDIETQTIGGMEISVYVINFANDKMVVKVPINRAEQSGLRPLMDKSQIDTIFETLNGKPKTGNRMWSRRAQEYETKINSGDIIAVAEVVRDLYKNVDSDRSYSERTIYESALNRLADEIAELQSTSKQEASAKLIDILKEKTAAA